MRFVFFILLQSCINSELIDSKRMNSSVELYRRPLKVFLSYNDTIENVKYIETFLIHAAVLTNNGLFSFYLVKPKSYSNRSSVKCTFLKKLPSENELKKNYQYIIPFLNDKYMKHKEKITINNILQFNLSNPGIADIAKVIPLRLKPMIDNSDEPLTQIVSYLG